MVEPKRSTAAALNRLLEEGIKPHARTLAEIAAAGNVAIVVFDLAADDDLLQAAARAAGWDGRTAVFPMARDYKEQLAMEGDAVTAAWLTREPSPDPSSRVLRIFVFTGRATFLVNYVPGRDYSFEPGSLDSERA
jgi:hypothetical protein